jgi:hypothetical protein
MDFTEIIQTLKPNIAKGSIKTYNSLLKNAYKSIWEDTDKPDIEKFKDIEAIKKYIQDKPISSQKTIVAAVTLVAPSKEYTDMITEFKKQIKAQDDKMVMNEKQEEKDISKDEILQKYDELEKHANNLYTNSNLTMKDIQAIQDYVLVALVSGKYIPPRRSLDWTEMRFQNFIEGEHNYVSGNKFYFHIFKTAKYYEEGQAEKIPKELQEILYYWLAIRHLAKIDDNYPYLFFNSNGEKLTPTTLNQRLNKLFGGKISINEMRHAHLTHRYAETMEQLKALEEEMTRMASNKNQATKYIKLDAKR